MFPPRETRRRERPEQAAVRVLKDLARAAGAALVVLFVSQAPAPAQTNPEVDLLDSAKLGQLARTRQLLSMGAGVNTADRRGFTVLMWASAGGHAEMVQHLLESGAAPDKRAADGTTALMLAAANGFTDVVRALLSRGVNVAAATGRRQQRHEHCDGMHYAGPLWHPADYMRGCLPDFSLEVRSRVGDYTRGPQLSSRGGDPC